MPSASASLRRYASVIEAAVLLLWARLLVRRVPMGYWRGSLGTIRDITASASEPANRAEVPPELRAVVSAVHRATFRLPLHLRCLPRAMAVQWMARRRGLDCALIIGIEPGGPEPLHAWIECGAVTVIGRLPGRFFVPLMTIGSVPARTNSDASTKSATLFDSI